MARDDVEVIQPAKNGLGTKASNFGKAIYNHEKGEFIGRTASSWAKIGLFYLVFYSCLAGFFAIMLVGFFSTLDDKAPTQQKMYSLIKQNPGMGFRPMPSIESTLIRFDAENSKSYAPHVENIKKLLVLYAETPKNAVNCSIETPKKNETCGFNIEQLGQNCTEAEDFGYKSGKPCVLLKINRVFDWMPVAFDNISLSDPDNHMAQDAKRLLGPRLSSDNIGISCEGENDGDADNLGEVLYYPNLGFSYDYYPYKNVENYRSPLLFVQFPNVKPGAIIQVWCKLWATNIKHHKNDKAGSTHFELLVDKTK